MPGTIGPLPQGPRHVVVLLSILRVWLFLPGVHRHPAIYGDNYPCLFIDKGAVGIGIENPRGLVERCLHIFQSGVDERLVIDIAGIHIAGIEGFPRCAVESTYSLRLSLKEIAAVLGQAAGVVAGSLAMVFSLGEPPLIDQGAIFSIGLPGTGVLSSHKAACIQDFPITGVEGTLPLELVIDKGTTVTHLPEG